jgi:peptide/nickel transport system permease protein
MTAMNKTRHDVSTGKTHPLLFFILRRVGAMILILLVTVFIFFFFMSLAPGDFFSAYYQNPEIDKRTIDFYRNEFGLDQPFYVQFFFWLKKVVFDFDLGMSFSYRMPILQLIGPRLLNSIFLNLFSLLFSFTLVYPIAFYFAYRPRKILDRTVSTFTLILYSTPPFFLALLGLILASATGIFPLGGATSVKHESLSLLGKIVERLHYLILPVLVGFLGGLAGSIRSMQVLLHEEFGKPYILAARARGVRGFGIVMHAFRNALIPFITGMSDILAGLISGSLFTEIIFSYPGIGQLMYEATLRKDYYLVLTNLIIGDLLVLAGILISDIILAIADPRVRIK